MENRTMNNETRAKKAISMIYNDDIKATWEDVAEVLKLLFRIAGKLCESTTKVKQHITSC